MYTQGVTQSFVFSGVNVDSQGVDPTHYCVDMFVHQFKDTSHANRTLGGGDYGAHRERREQFLCIRAPFASQSWIWRMLLFSRLFISLRMSATL